MSPHSLTRCYAHFVSSVCVRVCVEVDTCLRVHKLLPCVCMPRERPGRDDGSVALDAVSQLLQSSVAIESSPSGRSLSFDALRLHLQTVVNRRVGVYADDVPRSSSGRWLEVAAIRKCEVRTRGWCPYRCRSSSSRFWG